MDYFLGVDGGGTKTKFVVVDEAKRLVSEYTTTSMFALQVGAEAAEKTFQDGLDNVLRQAGISVENLKYACLGLAGYGEVEQEDRASGELVKIRLPGVPAYLCNDVEIGWAGALECASGIHIVSGTGSISFGRDDTGKTARAGGWGHLFGDEGSAYRIAVETLEAYTKQKDGRMRPTILLDVVERELGIRSYFEIMDIVFSQYREERDKIAAVARTTGVAAKEGDPCALAIFQNAAAELALLAYPLVKTLAFDAEEKIPVSYTGGVFKSGELILGPLRAELRKVEERLTLTQPKSPACYGAALYARQFHVRRSCREQK